MYLIAAVVVALVGVSLLVLRVLRSRGGLLGAIRQGKAARVEALLRGKPQALAAARESVRGPLQAAAATGRRDIVDLLLAHGVDPAGIDGWGQGALHVAALHGHVELVRRFLELGVDVNQRARRATSDKVPARPGATPLHFACGAGQLEVLNALLEKGAAWDSVDERALSALHEVAARSGSVEVARRLLALGCAVDAVDCLGQTPLMLALAYKRTALAALLVAHGASPHARGPMEFTPLHLAALRGLEDLVSALLAAGANPLAANDLGQKPVDVARAEGHAAVAALLEEAGARAAVTSVAPEPTTQQEGAAVVAPPLPRTSEG
ncbi:ankyrin repeat domain-containing protein [Pyxidicoccus parkwayensis]|uniref:Ankyrin repeat domain-containing protein n=1 Tax=Pyxidicoccus parkwayensis TaxID=2813578 RepID=A0ABX7NNP0_9BACT|nr:ankyrin repeat domain-containing protein [Pyxidicoccus parkwaysis]QSQ20061.1 ankyrin repeat domain-containing protein [Pyxidicoccus parkwaysis]